MPIALDSFHWCGRFVAEGDEVPASDPVVKACPGLFRSAPKVEQATAAPGEVRQVAKRVAKAAKKAVG